MRRKVRTLCLLMGSLLITTVSLLISFGIAQTPIQALELASRSLDVNSSLLLANTTHTFSFTFPDNSLTGSIVFEYCTSPLAQVVCNRPTGLDVSQATLQSQVGETGFGIESQNANEITLSRPPVSASNDAVQYVFNNVINPDLSAGTFYVRISTYSTSDGSGSSTDYGAVVSSTTNAVNVNTEVPPILDFCAGQNVTGNCVDTTGSFIQFGNLSKVATSSGTSQLAAGTNASSGLVITANGPTMTSGNDTITALSLPTGSRAGTSQFGINLRANAVPSIGSDYTGSGVIVPTGSYSIPNQFKFQSGDVIASSPGPSNFNTLTISYIVNISPSQTIGIYDTTITYICTASF
jgi:hypothetical protein